MSCCADCSGESMRAESLRRLLDTAELDLAEMAAERAGMLAEISRLRGQLSAMASQATGVVP